MYTFGFGIKSFSIGRDDYRVGYHDIERTGRIKLVKELRRKISQITTVVATVELHTEAHNWGPDCSVQAQDLSLARYCVHS